MDSTDSRQAQVPRQEPRFEWKIDTKAAEALLVEMEDWGKALRDEPGLCEHQRNKVESHLVGKDLITYASRLRAALSLGDHPSTRPRFDPVFRRIAQGFNELDAQIREAAQQDPVTEPEEGDR